MTRFVPILDPAISSGEPAGSYPAFEEGERLGVWLRNSSGQPLVGQVRTGAECAASSCVRCGLYPASCVQVWPDDDTFFPDWTSPVTQQWWVDQITAFHDQLQFDGLWIDMNEPANFVAGSVQGCANNSLNFPPYKPGTEGADLLQKTVCLDAVQEAGLH